MASSSFMLFLSAMLLLLTGTSRSEEITAENYWKKLLPATPMSNSFREFLPSGRKGGLDTGLIEPTCSAYHNYPRSATMDEIKNNAETHFLFLEKDLKVGMKTKKLDFVKKGIYQPTFLPLKAAKAIPFSTSKFNDILKRFNVIPNSYVASVMKKSLESCEMEANEGETRFCATSLESMVDFVISQLKTNDVRLLTYSLTNKDEAHAKNQVYKVQEGIVEISNSKYAVACHVQSYPYAVFYCHKSTTTKSYIVPLVGDEDGSRVSAGAVCHLQTSSWNPKHASMLVLGAKPGAHICHFLSHGNYVFVPNN